MTEHRKKELFALLRLCFTAHCGARAMLESRKVARVERRAVRVVLHGLRYVQGFDPEIARWERDGKRGRG